jgi:hypothetical protein
MKANGKGEKEKRVVEGRIRGQVVGARRLRRFIVLHLWDQRCSCVEAA